MNADKAYHDFKNALNGLGLAMENLRQLQQAKSKDWRAILEAKDLASKAWKQLGHYYHEAREAMLESLGW